MNLLLLVVLVGTVAVVVGSLAYTLRWFSTGKETEPAPEDDHRLGSAHSAISPHDDATTRRLRQFFDGKSCAICNRPIAPVQRTGRKPGLFDPETGRAHSWDEIPNDGLPGILETQLPICFACEVAESFRQHHGDLVVDRHQDAQDRLAAKS